MFNDFARAHNDYLDVDKHGFVDENPEEDFAELASSIEEDDNFDIDQDPFI